MRTKRNRVRRTRGLVFGVGYEALEPRVVPAVVSTYFPFASELDPNSITTGPDNNLWFTIPEDYGIMPAVPAQIGSFNPTTGAMRFYPATVAASVPQSIVSGPQGDLWYIDGSTIASINPTTGAINNYVVPIANADLFGLAVGSDGNLWFTDFANTAVGEFNPTTHVTTEFPMPETTLKPEAITSGPSGNLWFAVDSSSGSYDIGDINPTTHVITLTPVNLPSGQVTTITGGPDGNVWFNEYQPDNGNYFPAIASINTTTRVISQYTGGGLGGITTGPDGNIWYSNGLGTINVTSHVSTSYEQAEDAPPAVEQTIASNPDGKLYLANFNSIQAVSIIPANQVAIAGYVENDPTGTGLNTAPL